MEHIDSYEEWMGTLEGEGTLLLFVKTDNCSVCEGLLPQVSALEEEYAFPFYAANAAQVPELAGQLSLFTAPVVILFKEGREFARFARFVPMADLKHRMDELELSGGQYE